MGDTDRHPLFSFFRAPVTNTRPCKSITLLDAYRYIAGGYARQRTAQLRSVTDPGQARLFKAANFDYCTFSGTFTARSDKSLIRHSGLLCIDFDHLQSVESLRSRLLQDEYFDTQLLFRSPSGTGLKWVIETGMGNLPHAGYFHAVANYIRATYAVEADKSGSDVSRACFLPHDPDCIINPKYLDK